MNNDNKVSIKVGFRIVDQSRLIHHIRIGNVPRTRFKWDGERYRLSLNYGNSQQKVNIDLSVSSDIIAKKENTKRDITYLRFREERLDIEIERIYSINEIKKRGNVRYINYQSNQFQVKLHVLNQFTDHYFETKYVPKIERKRKRKVVRSKKNYDIPSNKLAARKKSTLSPEQLRRLDFYEADEYAYHHSQNSDGNRKPWEEFGGTGSNMRRGKRRY